MATIDSGRDADEGSPNSTSFWRTLPGLLTGVATLLTAVVGVLGVVSVTVENETPTTTTTASTATTVTTPPPTSDTTIGTGSGTGTGGSTSSTPTTQGQETTVPTTGPQPNGVAGYEVVRRDVTVAAGGFVRDTVVCPAGKVVLGGGASVVGEGSRDFRTVLQESSPGTIGGGAQALWLVSLRNGDTAAHKFGIQAVCATQPDGYQVVKKDSSVAPGAVIRNTALCPAGTVALGGGASVVGAGTGDFRTTIQESAPGAATSGGVQSSLWLAQVRNGGTVSRTVGIHTICAKAPGGYEIVRKDVAVNPSAVVLDTATCPSGKVVLGGGAQVVGEGSGDFKTVVQQSSPGTVNGGALSLWGAHVRNGDGVRHTVGLFAVCSARR